MLLLHQGCKCHLTLSKIFFVCVLFYMYVIPIAYSPLSFDSDALISVTTVQLGESVNFACFFSAAEYSSTRVKWYKQSTGDTLMLITSLMPATKKPTFEPRFPPSRFNVIRDMSMSTLTILKTIQEDEAIYHCGVTTWTQDQWSSTYLFLKGNTCLCIISVV